MAAKKPNASNTKAEILQAYEELAKEKAALSQVVQQNSSPIKEQKPPEQKQVMNPQSVQQRMNYTIDSLSKIQFGFGSAVSELSEQLSREAFKLEEIQLGVATEIQQLKDLHALEVDDGTLGNLIKAYEDNSKAFDDEFNQRSEVLKQERLEQTKAWLKEQEEHKSFIKERNDILIKNRQRDTAEYKYDLQLHRKLNVDEYEQNQKLLYKQMEELQQEQEKQWAEREKAIAEREKQFAEYKTKVEAFPKEKEAAVKKATEEGKGIAHYQAKIKSDLYAKDVEGQKRFYELRLQSLEGTIQNQETRIQNLSKQLESALKQVQDLAVKAIEGASNVSSLQAVKEIALEQAKTQIKNK